MRKFGIIAVLSLLVTAFAAVPVLAQAGHFVGTPTCTDQGTTLQCTGKVAGLGGTTFEISTEAAGIATTTCTNPAGNVAPGQTTEVDVTGTTGPTPTPRNGQFQFDVASETPTVPNTPTCPNNKWRATVTDVEFGDATLTLREDGVVSDTITVPVN